MDIIQMVKDVLIWLVFLRPNLEWQWKGLLRALSGGVCTSHELVLVDVSNAAPSHCPRAQEELLRPLAGLHLPPLPATVTCRNAASTAKPPGSTCASWMVSKWEL